MKRLLLLFFFTSLGFISLAQSEIKIDLNQWKGKKEKIPFTIGSVKDNRAKAETIGTISMSKSKQKDIVFDGNSAVLIQQFVNKNFTEGNGFHVRMEIDKLSIEETIIKKNKKVTAFIFACKFYKENGQFTEALYSFNARNSIPKKNGLKSSMTNYIGRALTAAILNFKKSYTKHPEWEKENLNVPTIEIDKNISFNQFKSKGDTLGLDGKYKLTIADFAGIVGEDEKDDAYSFLMITYNISSDDQGNKIILKVDPKAFFLRSRSWAKKSKDAKWLQHQQLLFDLASYHGLLFKKELEEKEFTAGFYKAEVNKIYNKTSASYFDEMDLLQAETKFGSNTLKEEEWKGKVDKYLGR